MSSCSDVGMDFVVVELETEFKETERLCACVRGGGTRYLFQRNLYTRSDFRLMSEH